MKITKSELRGIINEELQRLSESQMTTIKKTKNHQVEVEIHNGKYTVISAYYDKGGLGWIEGYTPAKDEAEAMKMARDEARRKTLTAKFMKAKEERKAKTSTPTKRYNKSTMSNTIPWNARAAQMRDI